MPKNGVAVAIALGQLDLVRVAVIGERKQGRRPERGAQPPHDECRKKENPSSAEGGGHAAKIDAGPVRARCSPA